MLLQGELTCVLRAAEAHCAKVARRVELIRTLPVCHTATRRMTIGKTTG